MNSDRTHETSQSEATSFTCPICLVEKRVIFSTTADNNSDIDATDVVRTNNTAVDENGYPVFQLSSCGHKFCTACLRAYVRSKLMDGQIDVPCCHFKISSPEGGEDFHQCNVLMEECDIYQLMHIVIVDCDESTDEWYARKKDDRGCDTLWYNKARGDDELWTKYQKLKFDLHHGKDSVRRCPKCDEAQIFDHECMKQHQAKFLTTQNDDPAATAAANNNSGHIPSGGMNLLERMLTFIRQRRLDVTDVISSNLASNEEVNVSVNDPGPEQESNLPKTGVKSADHANPTLPISADNKEDACISQHEGSILASTENNDECHDCRSTTARDGDDEAFPIDVVSFLDEVGPMSHGDLSRQPRIWNFNDGKQTLSDYVSSLEIGTCQKIETRQSKPPALLKSTTPCVTCPTCSTDFCYFHSNAHYSGLSSCIAYHKKSVELDRANTEYVSRTLGAKPCPTCGIPVSKEGGCNQIKCGSCGTHFCWICSAIVDDGAFPEHFRWWNVTGCANMQLDENNDPMRCTILGARLLSIFQIVVLGIPAVALTLLSIIVCPCIVLGCGATNRERVVNFISFWGSFLSSLLLLPFTCIGLLIISAVYCFVAGFKFFVKIFRRSRGADTLDIAVSSRPTNSNSADNLIRDLENILVRMEEGNPEAPGRHRSNEKLTNPN